MRRIKCPQNLNKIRGGILWPDFFMIIKPILFYERKDEVDHYYSAYSVF